MQTLYVIKSLTSCDKEYNHRGELMVSVVAMDGGMEALALKEGWRAIQAGLREALR
jgi:hypothetical protein